MAAEMGPGSGNESARCRCCGAEHFQWTGFPLRWLSTNALEIGKMEKFLARMEREKHVVVGRVWEVAARGADDILFGIKKISLIALNINCEFN